MKSFKGSIGNSSSGSSQHSVACKSLVGGSLGNVSTMSSSGSSISYNEIPYPPNVNVAAYLLRDYTQIYASGRSMGADYDYYCIRYVSGSYDFNNWSWDDYTIDNSSGTAILNSIKRILNDDSRYEGDVVYKSSIKTSLDLYQNTIYPGSYYDDCYIVVEYMPVYIDSDNYYHWNSYYSYSYNKFSDLNNTRSRPTNLSWDGSKLSWTRNSTGYPTVEFCPTSLPSYHEGFRTAGRDVAYEVCCQGTESDNVSGESIYTRGKTRYGFKSIPVYYDTSRASSSFARQVRNAIDDVIDIINSAIGEYGYELQSKVSVSVSDSDASYDTDVADTSFRNGITVIAGGNDELDAPWYNWGNWWDELDDDGYIFRSKCLIYEDVDDTHPYMSDTLIPIVLEEMLESMGCGNDYMTNPYSIFSDYVMANKADDIINNVSKDVYDLSVVRMTYSLDITETLEEAAILLKPSRGQYRASYNSTSTRLDFLEPGTSYTVKVWMAYYGAYSDYSSSLTVSIPVLTVSDLVTTRVNGGFKFSWTGTSSASRYRVRLVRNYDSYEIEKTTSSTNTTITGLQYGVTYTVYVQPYNNYYEGDEFFGYGCTTAPAQPRATASVNSSGVISVDWYLYNNSNISQVWINLYDSTNTTCLQTRTAYNTTEGVMTFDAVSDGTYYIRLRSMFSINGQNLVCVNSSGVDYTYTISITVSTKPEPWSWTSSNGSASTAQTKNAYTAITTKGYTTNFSYLVWNDFVDKVQEFLEYDGIANSTIGSSKYGYSSSTTYTNLLKNAKMTSSDKEITAKRFNIVRYCIHSMNSTGLSDVSVNSIIYGSYFTTLATKLNAI